jgi:hypothetical protein
MIPSRNCITWLAVIEIGRSMRTTLPGVGVVRGQSCGACCNRSLTKRVLPKGE